MLTWLMRRLIGVPFAYDQALSSLEENRMSEVVVVGSFKAEPGKEVEALEAFKALVEPTHAEDGCILYALHRGADAPSRLTFVERWASRETLAPPPKSPPGATPRERAPELFGASGDITVFEAGPGGETKKGSLAAHAGG